MADEYSKQRLPRYQLPDYLRRTSWRLELGGDVYDLMLWGYEPAQHTFPQAFTVALSPARAIQSLAPHLDNETIRQRIRYALGRIQIEPKEEELAQQVEQAFKDRKFVLHRCIPKVTNRIQLEEILHKRRGPYGPAGYPKVQPDPPRPEAKIATGFEVQLVDEVGEALEGVRVRVRVDPVGETLTTDADGRVQATSREGWNFGVARIDDVEAVRNILAERWAQVRPGDRLQLAKNRTFVTCPDITPIEQPMCQMTKGTLHTLAVQPDVVLVRCSVTIFEPNDFFPMPDLEVSKLLARSESLKGTILVVGHARSAESSDGNASLAIDRARTMAALLQRDVEAWLRNYGSAIPEERRWGKMHDQRMLSEILRRTPDTHALGRERVRWFQRSRGLAVDGVLGEETRKALIAETMAHTGVRIPKSMRVEVHGGGEAFPAEDTEPEDRPIELLFFFDGLGILPRPSSPTSTDEYPEWLRRAHDVRVVTGGGRQKPTPAPTLTVSGTRFAFDSSFPAPGVAAPLRFAVEALDDDAQCRITVFGHADASGSAEFNKHLSDRRAKAFVALLTGDLALFDDVATAEDWGLATYQAMLRGLGPNPGPIDGQFGRLTRKAILGFQNEYGRGVYHRESHLSPRSPDLAVRGELDEPTKAALRDAYVATLGASVSPSRLLGPGHAGCSEFNPLGKEAREQRRVTLALFTDPAPASTDFPCVEGEAFACPIEGTGPRKCPFYREVVAEPDEQLFAGDEIPFFDFQWLKGSATRTHMSAITVLPDDTEVTFSVYRTREDVFPRVPDAGRGTAAPEPGELITEVDGIVKGGIVYAVWEHASEESPFVIATWLTNLGIELEPHEDDANEPAHGGDGSSQALFDTPAFSPPVFRIMAEGLWGLSMPPGRQLNRVYFEGEPGSQGVVVRSDGFVVGFGAGPGTVTSSDDVLILSVATSEAALKGARSSTHSEVRV